MDDFTDKHLKDLYGLNPNILPFAFQFPRIPPGFNHPMFISANSEKEKFIRQNKHLFTNLQDFQQTYQKHASGLLDMSSEIIPPGHPLFSRQTSIDTIQTERDKLLKENLELKKQLEELSKEKPMHE